MLFNKIRVPKNGQKIEDKSRIPDNPIIGFIEGDGIGIDITPVMLDVVNAAVEKAYNGTKQIHWLELYAGEKATKIYGPDVWLPAETLAALQEFKVAIKGPLTTPVGGGFRSINVTLRQKLDLYLCLRPIKYYPGVPSPLKQPELTNMVIFRENSEDIYAGIEWQAGSDNSKKIIKFLQQDMGVTQIRFPENCGIGVKPVSEEGTKRLVRRAIKYALETGNKNLTLVHKGNIMKYTEGAFKNWGYELAKQEFGAQDFEGGPWQVIPNKKFGLDLIINDVIADAFLQQILLRPQDYGIIATLNLNGDYISDALAAQVGGIGIAPGANLSDSIGLFEPTHGTAPRYAGKNNVNPSSIILSAVMMLEYMGWHKSAELIENGLSQAILNKTVTYDFARMMNDAKLKSTSEFGQEIIKFINQA